MVKSQTKKIDKVLKGNNFSKVKYKCKLIVKLKAIK